METKFYDRTNLEKKNGFQQLNDPSLLNGINIFFYLLGVCVIKTKIIKLFTTDKKVIKKVKN